MPLLSNAVAVVIPPVPETVNVSFAPTVRFATLSVLFVVSVWGLPPEKRMFDPVVINPPVVLSVRLPSMVTVSPVEKLVVLPGFRTRLPNSSVEGSEPK